MPMGTPTASPTASATAGADPRLPPARDYGTLGPGSDLVSYKPVEPRGGGGRVLAAILMGVILALPFVATGSVRAAWQHLQQFFVQQGWSEPVWPAVLSQHDLERLDRHPAQKQAELLLERAVNHSPGASDQIAARVDRWRGRLRFTNSLNSLLTAALNSNDLGVRAIGVEVDLAAYNVAKMPASADRLIAQANSSDRATRIWALWTLGLIANRGVETDRITQTLIDHLHDQDPVSRQWTVEGLALVGSEAAVEPLLQTFHDDPVTLVRERAACSLAQSGLFTEELRRSAIPKILTYTDDPALDAPTHAFAFHALRDITGQNLPDDPAAWQSWYEANR